jgi:tRNA modification GTPase
MAEFSTADTIVARGTPAGRGGISIIRVAGPLVRQIAKGLLGIVPKPRYATLLEFRGSEPGDVAIDSGIALFFPGPRSFTGDDMLELHAHGSPVVVDALLERICSLGARHAEPGEFSRRAFLNDKLDLTQAEAIADLIDASSRTAARAAWRSMQGQFSAKVHELNEQVTSLRVYVEAALDFPEEEIDFLSDAGLLARLESLRGAFESLEKTTRQGCMLRDGVVVVLAGRPNAGKSSLLNALAGYDAAIVTPIAGTTRDLVREHIEINGLPVNIIDTAGLHSSEDTIEAEGMRRARGELAKADHALLIVDSTDSPETAAAELLRELPAAIAHTIVWNKIDLAGGAVGVDSNDHRIVRVSALTGEGVDQLRQHLEVRLGYKHSAEGGFTARQRHLQSLRKASEHFSSACIVLSDAAAGELMADELLQVQNALAEITGEFSSDDLLGRIFESFCIGK